VGNIFVTSDTHFHHGNIIESCNRPFKNSFEMDETLIENWNKVVKQGDKIYHLGDVYMPKYKDEMSQLFSRLNGTKVLILGNHDKGKDQNLLRFFSRIYMWRFLKEFGLLLTHVPVHQDSLSSKLKFNIHGHIHNKPSPKGPYINACVEMTEYSPMPIEYYRDYNG
jgi:calcineurin-like phosphoesterase family protein